jgi:hypothetical protein
MQVRKSEIHYLYSKVELTSVNGKLIRMVEERFFRFQVVTDDFRHKGLIVRVASCWTMFLCTGLFEQMHVGLRIRQHVSL